MSRSTRWIVSGVGLLILGAIVGGVGMAEGGAPPVVLIGGLLALAGIFSIQVGVMALAVHIGTYEIRQTMSASPGRADQTAAAAAPPRGQHVPSRPSQ